MVNVILILVSFTLTFIVILVAIFWKDILSTIKPQDYASVTILESDNNVRNLIMKKTDDLRFEFNRGKYNLFEAKIDMLSNVHTSIYRKGRLGHFFFIEGNENPIDFRNMKITGNPQLNEALLKQDFSKLWEEPKTAMQELLTYIVPILVVIGIVIIIVVIIKSGGNPTGIPEAAVVQ